MIINIDRDERYPDYYISDHKLGKDVDVPDDFLARYEEAANLYEAMQIEMETLYKGS